MIGVIIVDVVHDFTHGKFGNQRTQNCVKKIEKLLKISHQKNWPVILTKDTHMPGDKEFEIWGEHSLKGSKGAKLAIKPEEKDIVISTMRYDTFYQTPLETILKTKEVEKIILAGISTDICVQHTAAGAFFRNYDTFICKECTGSIDKKSKNQALEYMNKMYGTKIISLEEIKEW